MITDDLLAFINDEISLDPTQEVGLETDLLLTGLVDSLGVVEIVAWIEDATGGTVDPSDVVLEHFQTVQRMVDFTNRTFGTVA